MLKRFFKLICFGVPLMMLQAYSAQAQLLLEENFDYATGDLTTVSGGNWVNIGGTQLIPVTSGSLSYTGYPAAGIGNKITIDAHDASAQDAYRQFATQVPDGNVYVSFLLKITSDTLAPDTSTYGDYFMALLPSTSTTVYVGRIMTKKGSTADKFKLGLRATATNPTAWLAPDYDVNATYLVVLGYNLITGDANDVVKMWINPAMPGSEPAADLSQTTASATDPADIARIAIRQGYTSASSLITPDADIDGIQVGTTWSDITGVVPTNPSVSNTSPVNNAVNVLPNATIQVTFDQLMNAATIDTASFAVSGIKQARYYPDSIRPASNSASYTFYVQDSLRKSDTITVTLSTAIADTGGNHLLSPHSWTFYTVVPETMKPYLVSSSPANGADRIAVNSNVVLTFNEALLPTSVDTSAFELLGVKNPKYPINPPVLSVGNTVVTLTPVDSLYSGDTVTVLIKPGLTDLSGNAILSDSIVFMTRVSPNLTIYDIQYTTDVTGDSPYDKQTVTVSGVVTAVLKSGTFFIQDGPGEWNGIYIFKYSEVAVPEVGDSVTVTGDVSEYYNLTEIAVKLAGNLIILKKGCALPEPTLLTTGGISNESYESVLIETRNVGVTAVDTVYKEWQINDGSGMATVNDFIATAVEVRYNPVIGDTLVHVRGIIDYNYGAFKIEPRRMGDVKDNKPVKIVATMPAANNTNVPTAASIQINFNKPMRSYTVIPANFALSGNLSGTIPFNAIYDAANWSCHLIPAQSFAPGESIKVTAYHALLDSFDRSLDGNGDGTATADSTDDYSFSFTTLLGGVPIGDIQQPGPDGFASNMVNQTVLIEGVVTGPDSFFTYPGNSTASWYLQDETGGVNIYGGDINTFELGMRVVVEGKVTEYSGVTEISSSTAKISIWNKAQTLPAAKEMVYNQFPNEAVEGLLISFTGTISSPPSLAGGGYNMDVRNGNSPIAIRFNETAGFDIAKLTLGAKVRVTGIVSQYDKNEPFSSGYQIVPRFALSYTYNGIQYPADIELLADSVLPTNAPQITNILPNPFSPDYGEVANIELNAPSADHLTLRLYDLKGRLVKTLLNNTMGGHQIVPWDGTDQMNRRVNIGIYIVHLRCVAADGKTTDQTKLLVMGTKLK